MTCLFINPFIVRSVAPSLVSEIYSDAALAPADATSTLQFGNDGRLFHNVIGYISGQWLTHQDAVEAALYELEVVITSGSAFNAPGTTAAGAGVWRDLASNWTYGNTFTGLAGAQLTVATFTIRRKSDLVTMASASLTIDAEVT